MVRLMFIGVTLALWGSETRAQPSLAWPVDAELNREVVLQMHPDNDRAEGSMSDYRCDDQYVYDGHRGTDITALATSPCQLDQRLPAQRLISPFFPIPLGKR